jgi:hypothetical protein
LRNNKLSMPLGALNLHGMGGVLGPDSMGTINAPHPGASISTANLQSLLGASLAGRLPASTGVAATPPTTDQKPDKPGKQAPVTARRRVD